MKQIDLYSCLWLRWKSDSHMISSRNRELPIEFQYESSGISFQFYASYQIRRDRENNAIGLYILTTAGRILFNQQIVEAIQGISKTSWDWTPVVTNPNSIV